MAGCYILVSCDNRSYPDIGVLCYNGEGLHPLINKVVFRLAVPHQTYVLKFVGFHCECDGELIDIDEDREAKCEGVDMRQSSFVLINCDNEEEQLSFNLYEFPGIVGSVVKLESMGGCWYVSHETGGGDFDDNVLSFHVDCSDCKGGEGRNFYRLKNCLNNELWEVEFLMPLTVGDFIKVSENEFCWEVVAVLETAPTIWTLSGYFESCPDCLGLTYFNVRNCESLESTSVELVGSVTIGDIIQVSENSDCWEVLSVAESGVNRWNVSQIFESCEDCMPEYFFVKNCETEQILQVEFLGGGASIGDIVKVNENAGCWEVLSTSESGTATWTVIEVFEDCETCGGDKFYYLFAKCDMSDRQQVEFDTELEVGDVVKVNENEDCWEVFAVVDNGTTLWTLSESFEDCNECMGLQFFNVQNCTSLEVQTVEIVGGVSVGNVIKVSENSDCWEVISEASSGTATWTVIEVFEDCETCAGVERHFFELQNCETEVIQIAEFTDFVIVGSTITVAQNGVCWSVLQEVDSGRIWNIDNVGQNIVLSDILYKDGEFISVGGNVIFKTSDIESWAHSNHGVSAKQCIRFLNGLYVIIGQWGGLITSTDGINWATEIHLGGIDELKSIDYGNGVFVTVGTNGVCFTSTDGVTWTAQTMGNTSWFYSIKYANGVFVAVGHVGAVQTSSDGVTWNVQTNVSQTLNGIDFGNGLFVAVGSNGYIVTSTDGVTWTQVISGTSVTLNNIKFKNGKFVAVGYNGTILFSNNGTNWNLETSGLVSEHLFGIDFHGETYVAVGVNGVVLKSLPESEIWNITGTFESCEDCNSKFYRVKNCRTLVEKNVKFSVSYDIVSYTIRVEENDDCWEVLSEAESGIETFTIVAPYDGCNDCRLLGLFVLQECTTEEIVHAEILQGASAAVINVGDVIQVEENHNSWTVLSEGGDGLTIWTYSNHLENCSEAPDPSGYCVEDGERTIAYATMVEIPNPQDPQKAFKECCYTHFVFADLNSNENYKNDYSSFFHQKQISSENATYKLVHLETSDEFVLNNDQFGTFFPFNSFPTNPNLNGYLVNWKKVLTEIGEGNFQVIKTINIVGIEVEIRSFVFTLRQYSTARADKTIRMDVVMNGLLQKSGVDFTGVFWKSSIRVPGFFGRREPQFEEDNIISRNFEKRQISMKQTNEFKFQTNLIPDCVTDEIIDFMIFGNDIFMNDYNLNNHSYRFSNFGVKFASNDGTYYSAKTRKAQLNLVFNDKFENNLKRNYN